MTFRILLVEDDHTLRVALSDALRDEGHAVSVAHDGHEARATLRAERFDLVVLDIMLPQVDGFEVLRQLRARGDEVPVLVLSAKARDEDRIRGLELRADDYLTKPFHLRELLLRVDALLRRAVSRPGEIDELRLGEKRVDLRAMRVLGPGVESAELSATEARLLRLLAARPGEVVGRAELVRQLFGPATPLTSRTLDNLVLHLRKLVESDPANPRHLHTVRGVGWRLDPSGAP